MVTTSTPHDQSVEIVNRLLRLPDEEKLQLSQLLAESVDEGFTSLEEGEEKDLKKIQSRIERYLSGQVETREGKFVVEKAKSMLAEYQQFKAKYRQ